MPIGPDLLRTTTTTTTIGAVNSLGPLATYNTSKRLAGILPTATFASTKVRRQALVGVAHVMRTEQDDRLPELA